MWHHELSVTIPERLPQSEDRRRLTYFNFTWDTEYLGYSIMAGVAFNFNPTDPNRSRDRGARHQLLDPVDGAAIPPESGTCALRILAISRGQLRIGGHKVTYGRATRQSATTTATAGTPIGIEMDYEHGWARPTPSSRGMLPGASTQTLIPTAALSATAP